MINLISGNPGDNCYANEWTTAIHWRIIGETSRLLGGLRGSKNVAQRSSRLRRMTFWLASERTGNNIVTHFAGQQFKMYMLILEAVTLGS